MLCWAPEGRPPGPVPEVSEDRPGPGPAMAGLRVNRGVFSYICIYIYIYIIFFCIYICIYIYIYTYKKHVRA